MNGFYVSLIFFGILLVLFSLACIFLDKKKVLSFVKSYDDKKQELVEIISDAEQMVEELNRFSDYIVNQMDLKNEELSKNLKLAEEKVNALSERAGEIFSDTGERALNEMAECREHVLQVQSIPVKAVKVSNVEVAAAFAVNSGVNSRLINTVDIAAAYSKFDNTTTVVPVIKREKVVPINNKYSEVIRLSQEGIQGLEIAKRLKMGKGEVELILGLRK